MPIGLTGTLGIDSVRDLIAYLTSPQQPQPGAKPQAYGLKREKGTLLSNKARRPIKRSVSLRIAQPGIIEKSSLHAYSSRYNYNINRI